MRAARTFVEGLAADGLLDRSTGRRVAAVRLARRDRARPRQRQGRVARPGGRGPGDRRHHASAEAGSRRSARPDGCGSPGAHEIAFDENRDLVMHRRKSLPYHPNGMTFVRPTTPTAPYCATRTYYSVGGGFVVDEDAAAGDRIVAGPDAADVPVPVPAPSCSPAAARPACRSAR